MDDYKGRPFALIGVNAGDELADGRAIVDKYNLNWRSFHDPDLEISEAFGIGQTRGLPLILVLDQDGKIQYEYQGDKDELDAKIEELVKAVEMANAD